MSLLKESCIFSATPQGMGSLQGLHPVSGKLTGTRPWFPLPLPLLLAHALILIDCCFSADFWLILSPHLHPQIFGLFCSFCNPALSASAAMKENTMATQGHHMYLYPSLEVASTQRAALFLYEQNGPFGGTRPQDKSLLVAQFLFQEIDPSSEAPFLHVHSL